MVHRETSAPNGQEATADRRKEKMLPKWLPRVHSPTARMGRQCARDALNATITNRHVRDATTVRSHRQHAPVTITARETVTTTVRETAATSKSHHKPTVRATTATDPVTAISRNRRSTTALHPVLTVRHRETTDLFRDITVRRITAPTAR